MWQIINPWKNVATPNIGDSVDVDWGHGQHDPGTVERLLLQAAWLRLSGAVQMTLIVPVADLRKVGPNRWAVEL